MHQLRQTVNSGFNNTKKIYHQTNLFDSETDFEKDLFPLGWTEGGEETFLVSIFSS